MQLTGKMSVASRATSRRRQAERAGPKARSWATRRSGGLGAGRLRLELHADNIALTGRSQTTHPPPNDGSKGKTWIEVTDADLRILGGRAPDRLALAQATDIGATDNGSRYNGHAVRYPRHRRHPQPELGR